MRIKNISGVPQRIVAPGLGEVRVAADQCIEVSSSRFVNQNFVEVDEVGNPKRDINVRVTENDKRTMASDNEPVAAEVVKVVDVVVPEPVIDVVPVAPVVKAVTQTTRTALGRPKKL